MVVLALGAAFKLSLPAQEPPPFFESTPTILITVPRVWQDNNQNGIQDFDEKGMAEIKVSLLSVGTNQPIAQAVTDQNGRCELRVLSRPSHFRLHFELPPDTRFTATRRGSNESIDSDVNADGMTTPFYNRSFREGVDAGIVPAQ